MKNILILSTLVLFIFSACSLDDIPVIEEPPVLTVGSFNFKIDGQSYSSDTENTSATIIDENSYSKLEIAGSGSGTLAVRLIKLVIVIPEDLALEEGNYGNCTSNTITVEDICATFSLTTLFSTNEEDELAYGTGTEDASLNLTITSLDYRIGGSIKGVFSGMVEGVSDEELKSLTEGEFNVMIEE